MTATIPARLRRKAEVVKRMGGKCGGCGESRLAALTIHHPDGVQRSIPNGRGAGGDSTLWRNELSDDQWSEVDSCELLCSNCHQLHHAREWGRMTADELLHEVNNVPPTQAKPRRSSKGK